MQLGERSGLVNEINVAPMIDVLLVLLVIFMLAQQVRLIVPVSVPPPERPNAGPQTPQIVLEQRSDRSYAVNGTTVAKADLGGRLAAVFEGRGSKLLYIRTAAGWKYGEVVEAADIARGAGVQVIGYMPGR
jgi:biopolymer transport protein TolR